MSPIPALRKIRDVNKILFNTSLSAEMFEKMFFFSICHSTLPAISVYDVLSFFFGERVSAMIMLIMPCLEPEVILRSSGISIELF